MKQLFAKVSTIVIKSQHIWTSEPFFTAVTLAQKQPGRSGAFSEAKQGLRRGCFGIRCSGIKCIQELRENIGLI